MSASKPADKAIERMASKLAVRSMKRSLPRRHPAPPLVGDKREPSLACVGEGPWTVGKTWEQHPPKNPPAYGTWNASTVEHGTGETLWGRAGTVTPGGVGAGHSTV